MAKMKLVPRIGEVANELIAEYNVKSIGEIDLEPVVYDGGIYIKNQLWRLKSRIQELEPSADNPFVSEVVGRVQRITATSVKNFDANPSLICLKNGVLNIHTMTVLPFDPDYLMFSKLDIEYQPHCRSRAFERFMVDFLPDVDDRLRALDSFAATLLTRPIKKATIFLGETDSGKSTFLQIVDEFLGPENTSHVAIQDLETDRFAAADLLGKRANIYGDVDKAELKKSSHFKTSTGGDIIRAQRKFGHGFDLRPYAKHFYSANQAPQVSDDSSAFWNRWIPIRCPTRFVNENELESWRVSRTRGLLSVKVKIPNIVQRLTTPQAKSGILNILLKRLPQIIRLGTIPNAPTTEEVRQVWLLDANFKAQFLNATVRREPDGRVGRADLFSRYAEWCISRNLVPSSSTVFNREVEKLGAIRSEDGRGKFSQSGSNWKGIAWLDAAIRRQQQGFVAEVAVAPQNQKKPARSGTSARSPSKKNQSTGLDELRGFADFQELASAGEICPLCGRMYATARLLEIHTGLSHPLEVLP